MRGTLSCVLWNAAKVGIIPACAGNTLNWDLNIDIARDHPRVCGEHASLPPCRNTHRGSSPRVRGTLLVPGRRLVRRGIIPACAGNTPRSWGRQAATGDHPRVCGEHFYSIAVGTKVKGSSPRVRGTLDRVGAHDGGEGIIPACAGNTHGADYSWLSRRDHPRVCGEHDTRQHHKGWCLGSSPRVRGTLSPHP